MSPTKDIEIRAALHTKKLGAYHSALDTIVINELGLSHSKVRIDIAVINGCVHGYEIKSSLDTLERLPGQLSLYTQCLEKLTLVCASRHIERVEAMSPSWASIIEVKKGCRGAITFTTVRRGNTNQNIDPVQLAHLLWRSEAAALLSRFGVEKKLLNKSRKQLYSELAERMTVSQLTTAIREFMQLRHTWRDRPARA